MSGTLDAWRPYMNLPLLPPERERELLERSRGGDLRARDELVHHNLRLVVARARRYRHVLPTQLGYSDLLQTGAIALQRAIEAFRPGCGATRLSTLATRYIDQEYAKLLADNAHTLSMQRNVGSVVRMTASDPHITVDALADRAGISEDAARNILQSRSRVYLDAPASTSTSGTSTRTNAELYSDTATSDDHAGDVCDQLATMETITRLLAALTPREQRFLRMRFGLGDTPPAGCQEVADEFGIPVERVPVLERVLLERARRSGAAVA